MNTWEQHYEVVTTSSGYYYVADRESGRKVSKSYYYYKYIAQGLAKRMYTYMIKDMEKALMETKNG